MQLPSPVAAQVAPVPAGLSPLVAAQQALGLQTARQNLQLGKHKLAEGAITQQNAEQNAADEQEIIAAAKASGGDREKAQQILDSRNPRAGLKFATAIADLNKKNADNHKLKVETAAKEAESITQALQGVKDQASLDTVRTMHPDLAQHLPALYDDQAKGVIQQHVNEGVSHTEFLKQMDAAAEELRKVTQANDAHTAAGNASDTSKQKLFDDQQKAAAMTLALAEGKPPEVFAGLQQQLKDSGIPSRVLQTIPDAASAVAFVTPRQAARQRSSLQRDTMVVDGKPEDVQVGVDPDDPATFQKIFLRGQDVTAKASHYDRPRDADPAIAALRALELQNKTDASPGQVVFKSSGRPVGTQLPESAATRLEGLQTAIQQADIVEQALLKLKDTGAVKGYIEENGVYWPVVQDQLTSDRVAAVSETNRLLSAYAQAVSGLAVSEPEIKRLQRSAPSVKLTPEANKVIIGHFKRNAKAKLNNYLDVRGWKLSDGGAKGDPMGVR